MVCVDGMAVGIDGIYSRCIVAVLGITAGSGFATTELRLLLLDVIESTYVLWANVQLTLYVEDLTIEAIGDARLVTALGLASVADVASDSSNEPNKVSGRAARGGPDLWGVSHVAAAAVKEGGTSLFLAGATRDPIWQSNASNY